MISAASRTRLSHAMGRAASVALLALIVPATALAPESGNSGVGFEPWLERFKSKAAAQGISQSASSSALSGVSYDPTVVRLDRGQKSFKLSFEQFYARRVGSSLLKRGQSLMRT